MGTVSNFERGEKGKRRSKTVPRHEVQDTTPCMCVQGQGRLGPARDRYVPGGRSGPGLWHVPARLMGMIKARGTLRRPHGRD